MNTITDLLNILNQQGFFSYVVPFLLMFAVIYAILEKTGLFRAKEAKPEATRAISAVIAACIGLLALQFDVVAIFFANIFPKMGVGLAIFLVLLIFLGFFYQPDNDGKWPGSMTWIGWVVGIGVVLWALNNWNTWFGYGSIGFGNWFQDYFWALIIVAGVVGLIAYLVKK